MNKITLKVIAEATGVSRTTASFVLNGKGKEMKISDAVVNRVKMYAENHNYRPNPNAQSLRTGKSNVLLVMLENIYSEIARYMEYFALEKGYIILFCSNENSDVRSRSLLDNFQKHLIDGYIIVPSPNIQAEIRSLTSSKIPVILCDRYFPELEVSHVTLNNQMAMQEATQKLVLNNNKSFAYIGVKSNQTQLKGRFDGFEKIVRKKNLSYSVLFSDPAESISEETLYRFIDANITVDAFVFATNYLAKTALLYIHKKFTKRFSEINFLTFDDTDWFDFLPINIISIKQPVSKTAATCITQIINLIENTEKPMKFTKTIIEAEIIERIKV